MVTVYFTVIGGLLLAGLVMFAPWPPWMTLGIAAVLAAAGLLATLLFRRGQGSLPPSSPEIFAPEFDEPPMPPLGAEQRQCHVEKVPLPSGLNGYDFVFSATVLWRPIGRTVDRPEANLAELAVHAILKRAMKITRERDPGQGPLVRHELGAALATMEPDERGYLEAMADSIELKADDEERLRRIAEIRKRKTVWEHERGYEQSRREYFGDDVFKSPGSAVTWWLTKHEDEIQKTVGDIDFLAKLSSVAYLTELPVGTGANGTDGPAPANGVPPSLTGASPVDCFTAFLGSLKLETEHGLVANQLAEVVRKYRPEVAEEILRRFDPPPPRPAPDDDVPLPDPPPDPDLDGDPPF